jgi:adenosylcobinamide-phosphate synthase
LNYAFHLPTGWIAAAIALDLVLGDPSWLPHPVKLIGWLIAAGERRLYRDFNSWNLVNGAALAVVVIAISGAAVWIVIALAQRVASLAGAIIATLVASTTLAARGLDTAAYEVERNLRMDDLIGARRAIRSLVGRDPDRLDTRGLICATIESISENASDGFVAPLLFLVIGGPVGAIVYKAVNTLDSMIGYRDERYLYFGRISARLDDCTNLIPSRLTAICIALAAMAVTKRGYESWSTCWTDGHKHQSPNAGYPEAAMAGALGIELGGDAYYGDELEQRPTFGHGKVPTDIKRLRQARLIMWLACAFAALVLLGLQIVMTR